MKTKERVNRTVLSVRVKPEIKKYVLRAAKYRGLTASRYVEGALESIRLMAGEVK